MRYSYSVKYNGKIYRPNEEIPAQAEKIVEKPAETSDKKQDKKAKKE